jgi:hypothetical protein
LTLGLLVGERPERMHHCGATIRVVGFVVVIVRFVGAGKPFQRGAWNEDTPS